MTGKTSEGGIDGHGILKINPLLSFKVLFQCKKYQGSVSSSQVRDFIGAMLGRADKGIILITGRFTKQ
ncbi:MAG: restriction endonuclease [Halanaerobiales bacterium]|nr:restriction endonuclease [Halanaerobiales bacterium]